MDFKEAYDIYENYLQNSSFADDEDFFMFTEVVQLLYESTGDAKYMCDLGGAYYERKEFDLARKYYEIATEKGNYYANIGLGYIWYYGRTGECDYKKAFEYFSSCKGDINAEYKLADMYRTGKYVAKDQAKYEAKIEEIYDLLQHSKDKYYVPDIYSRLARIRKSQSRFKEEYVLLCNARKVLEYRIIRDNFFGDYSVMKGIIQELHQNEFYRDKQYDIFDLYVLFEKPHKAELIIDGKPQAVSAVEEDGTVVVECNGKWYRSADDFIKNSHDLLEEGNIPCVRIINGSV